ncbi:MAG: hypothetical protein AB1295_01035 [Candidatus Micrarchaeota archaeon]
MGFKLPEPKGDLSTVKAFNKTPLSLTRVLDALGGYVGLDQNGKPLINADRLTKVKELLRDFTKEQKDHVTDIISKIYLQKYLETSGQQANRYAKEEKTAERNAALGLGLAAANELARLKTGTSLENQKKVLEIASKGLNETQMGDMLRAALEMGYSMNVVFGAAKPKDADLSPSGAMSIERDRTIQQLTQASILMVNELNKRLKDAKKSGDQTEYKEAFAQLAAFYGSQKKAEDFVDMGIEGNESTIVAISAAAEMYAYGRLNNVRPVRLKQAVA